MSKKFSSKNSQRYVVVHRPHDDPSFYDTDASAHVLVPVSNPNKTSPEADLRKKDVSSTKPKGGRAHVGEAALYGINFDDSEYDYTQHLKPIGLDPENSIFIASKGNEQKVEKKTLKIYSSNLSIDVMKLRRMTRYLCFKEGWLSQNIYYTNKIPPMKSEVSNLI